MTGGREKYTFMYSTDEAETLGGRWTSCQGSCQNKQEGKHKRREFWGVAWNPEKAAAERGI